MQTPSTQLAQARIHVVRLLHTIHAVRDIRAARERYFDVLAAIAFGERFHRGEDRDMTLMYVADHMVELMSPGRPDAEDKAFARFVRRYGESYHSLELRVDDIKEAAARCRAAGFTLNTLYEEFFFVDAKSAGGIIIEVVGRPMRNDPQDCAGWNPDWMRGHASTLRRLAYLAFVPRNLHLALKLLTGVFDADITADVEVLQPQPCRRVSLRLGGYTVVLFSPNPGHDGPLSDFLSGPVSGLYALVWEVDSLSAARQTYAAVGVEMRAASLDPGGLAIPLEQMFGARHEFIAWPQGPIT